MNIPNKTKKICEGLLIALAVILVFVNIFSMTSYLFETSRPDIADFRKDVTIIFTCVFILSWFINKKIMVLVWIFAFSEVYRISLNIPELYEQQVYEYCADTNCNAQQCLKDHCFKVKTIF